MNHRIFTCAGLRDLALLEDEPQKLRDTANTRKLASEIIQQYRSGESLRIAKSQA